MIAAVCCAADLESERLGVRPALEEPNRVRSGVNGNSPLIYRNSRPGCVPDDLRWPVALFRGVYPVGLHRYFVGQCTSSSRAEEKHRPEDPVFDAKLLAFAVAGNSFCLQILVKARAGVDVVSAVHHRVSAEHQEIHFKAPAMHRWADLVTSKVNR